jgi:hypothetical protein
VSPPPPSLCIVVVPDKSDLSAKSNVVLRLVVVAFAAKRFVVVAFADVKLPDPSTLKFMFSAQLVPFHLSDDDVAVPLANDPPAPARSTPQRNCPEDWLYSSLSPTALQAVNPAPSIRCIVVVPDSMALSATSTDTVALVILAFCKVAFWENRFVEVALVVVALVDMRLVKNALAAVSIDEKKFVLVAFVELRFVAVTFVDARSVKKALAAESIDEKKLVDEAEVKLAFVTDRFVAVAFAAERFVAFRLFVFVVLEFNTLVLLVLAFKTFNVVVEVKVLPPVEDANTKQFGAPGVQPAPSWETGSSILSLGLMGVDGNAALAIPTNASIDETKMKKVMINDFLCGIVYAL